MQFRPMRSIIQGLAMAKKKVGDKVHKPDEKTRRYVESMAAVGLNQDQVAAVLDINPKTLRKYYDKELKTSKTKTIARVAGKLVEKALAGDVSSMIFYLKTQAKWKEADDEDEDRKPTVTFNIHKGWNDDSQTTD